MSVVATAALLVAIGLLVLAAAACVVQMTAVKDPRVRRLAHLYLEPLSVWCMAAVIVHALAVVAAGDIVALELILPIGIGVAAFLLRWADEPHEPGAQAPSATAASTGPTPGASSTPRPAASAGPTPAVASSTPRPVASSSRPAPHVAAPTSSAGQAAPGLADRIASRFARRAEPEPERAAEAPSRTAPPAPVRPASGSLWSRS
jgi:hypothetical protein